MSKQSFIRFLRGIDPEKQENRAMLAILRRGLRNGTATTDTFRYLAPHFSEKENDLKNHWMFVIAELFAIHPDFYKPPKPEPSEPGKEPKKTPRETIGRLFLRLEQTEKFGEGESLTRRFQALLKSHEDEVGEHLRHAIKLAKTHSIAVDYGVLLDNLSNWSHQEKFIQLQWAKDFWQRSSPEESNNSEASATLTVTD